MPGLLRRKPRPVAATVDISETSREQAAARLIDVLSERLAADPPSLAHTRALKGMREDLCGVLAGHCPKLGASHAALASTYPTVAELPEWARLL
jgi:hypothetical protein